MFVGNIFRGLYGIFASDNMEVETNESSHERMPKYMGGILQAIDSLAIASFQDSEIVVHMNSNVCFFLRNFKSIQHPVIPCDLITLASSSRGLFVETRGGLLTSFTIGLALKKTSWNSRGNLICSKFVEVLKTSALAYLTRLSCGWEEIEYNKSLNSPEGGACVFSNKYNNFAMGPSHCILKQIACDNEFDEIKISASLGGNSISGERERLHKFIKLLKEESPTPSLFKLLKLAKIDKNCKLYTSLPSEIIEQIIETYFNHTFKRSLIIQPENRLLGLETDDSPIRLTKSFIPKRF